MNSPRRVGKENSNLSYFGDKVGDGERKRESSTARILLILLLPSLTAETMSSLSAEQKKSAFH